MNQLAYELKIDPVKLRILNEPKIDEGAGLPFSSRQAVESLRTGGRKVRLVKAHSRRRLYAPRWQNTSGRYANASQTYACHEASSSKCLPISSQIELLLRSSKVCSWPPILIL